MRVFNLFSKDPGEGVTLTSLVLALKMGARGNRVLIINNSQKSGLMDLLKIPREYYYGDLTPYILADSIKREILIHSTFKYGKNVEVIDNERNLLDSKDFDVIVRSLEKDFDFLLIDSGTNGILTGIKEPISNIDVVGLRVETLDPRKTTGDFTFYNRIEGLPLFEEEDETIDFNTLFKRKKKDDVDLDCAGVLEKPRYAFDVSCGETAVELPFFTSVEELTKKVSVFTSSDFVVSLDSFYTYFNIPKTGSKNRFDIENIKERFEKKQGQPSFKDKLKNLFKGGKKDNEV